MSQSVDTVTLTTPDITNTVTTPGLIDIMTKNGMVVSEQGHNIAVSEAEQQFNQFSLQSQQLQSGMVMTAPQTITTQIEHRFVLFQGPFRFNAFFEHRSVLFDWNQT